jgi:hypothetical protein
MTVNDGISKWEEHVRYTQHHQPLGNKERRVTGSHRDTPLDGYHQTASISSAVKTLVPAAPATFLQNRTPTREPAHHYLMPTQEEQKWLPTQTYAQCFWHPCSIQTLETTEMFTNS